MRASVGGGESRLSGDEGGGTGFLLWRSSFIDGFPLWLHAAGVYLNILSGFFWSITYICNGLPG